MSVAASKIELTDLVGDSVDDSRPKHWYRLNVRILDGWMVNNSLLGAYEGSYFAVGGTPLEALLNVRLLHDGGFPRTVDELAPGAVSYESGSLTVRDSALTIQLVSYRVLPEEDVLHVLDYQFQDDISDYFKKREIVDCIWRLLHDPVTREQLRQWGIIQPVGWYPFED